LTKKEPQDYKIKPNKTLKKEKEKENDNTNLSKVSKE
jgi:hypothetical protein